ncbi:MAG: hypothetical protein ACI9JM_000416 [Halioglobus sp.]|jgi:hypothetical protein
MEMIDRQDDVFTHHVLSQIDEDVYASLTTEQTFAVQQAVHKGASFQKYRVDVRFSVPLYLMRLYFVILVDRDRPEQVRSANFSSRIALNSLSFFMSVYLFLAATLPLIFIALYITKSALGIDIFPDKHLSDFFW